MKQSDPGKSLDPTGQPPVQYQALRELLIETAALPWMVDPHCPNVEQKLPTLPWDHIWKRLTTPSIPPLSADLHYRALHDVLMTREEALLQGLTIIRLAPVPSPCGGWPPFLHILSQGSGCLGLPAWEWASL